MISLQEVFIKEELATVLMNYYNKFNSQKPIDVEFANLIMEHIGIYLYNYLTLPTDFSTIEKGKEFIQTGVKVYAVGLVKEYINYRDSINSNLAEIHRQSKFNPLDNEHINDAPIRKDDTVYDLGSSMLSGTNFIMKNSIFTKTFIRVILNHCQRVF